MSQPEGDGKREMKKLKKSVMCGSKSTFGCAGVV